MSSVFGRFNYNFETERFGDALNLSNGAKNFLNVAPIMISGWQISDLANGSINRTDYFKNPTANVCAQMTANLNSIITICTTDNANAFTYSANAARQLGKDAANLVLEIARFKSHTDNISGVTSISSDAATIPFFETATSIGAQMVQILNKTDDISNTLPYLGSTTSLFISDILQANTNGISNCLITITSTYATPNYTISSASVNNIIDYTKSVANVLSTRRIGDWTFYQNSMSILRDYSFLSRFTTMGGTQKYLINNLIGTDSLNSKLSSNN